VTRGRSAGSSVRCWEAPPRTLQLADDEVHLWRAALDYSGAELSGFEQLLSEDERARAARFLFPRDRQHFTAARAVLRSIVASYVNMAPNQLQFSVGPHGKPALATGFDASTLSFNVSHSRDVALYAISGGCDVGVDVEHVSADTDVDQMAERFFSPRELATFRLLPSEEKQYAFFTCWVRKEAYVKARGNGLAIPLDTFTVSFSPGEPAALLDVAGYPEEPAAWCLWELDVAPSCAAALAANSRTRRLRHWQFGVS